MYRKCATEVSAENQKRVTGSLLELMLRMSYDDITVTQLCQTAGVTRRVFYHLFSNKTDALHALIDQRILGIESCYPDVPDEALRFVLYWRDQKSLLDALRRNNLSNLLLERMVKSILDEAFDVRYWVKAYDRTTGTDIIIFNLCGIMGLTYGWYYTGFQRPPEEVARRLSQLVQKPLPE